MHYTSGSFKGQLIIINVLVGAQKNPRFHGWKCQGLEDQITKEKIGISLFI